MAPESEAQRLARLDREATRNSRIRRALNRDATHRQREQHADWLEKHGAPAPRKTESDKS